MNTKNNFNNFKIVIFNKFNMLSKNNIFNPLTAKLFYMNKTHLKLCLTDAINNFKWVKIIQIWQDGGVWFLRSFWLLSRLKAGI